MTDTDKLDLLLAYQRLQFLRSVSSPSGEEYAEMRSLHGALELCNSSQYGQINKQATGIRALPAEDPVVIQIVNPDATDCWLTMKVDAASVANIIMWYGAFYAGDDYTVSLNGVAQTLNHNGEIITK